MPQVSVAERFLRYSNIKINSPAPNNKEEAKATPGQVMFGNIVIADIRDFGVKAKQITRLINKGILVYFPASYGMEDVPHICFNAHLDAHSGKVSNDSKAGIASLVMAIAELQENKEAHGALTFWFSIQHNADTNNVPAEIVSTWNLVWTVPKLKPVPPSFQKPITDACRQFNLHYPNLLSSLSSNANNPRSLDQEKLEFVPKAMMLGIKGFTQITK